MGAFCNYILSNFYHRKVMFAIVFICVIAIINANAQQAYQMVALQMHNRYRQAHGAPNLALDSNLNRIAEQCAQYYVTRGTIDHSCPYKNGVGENLYSSSGLSRGAALGATDMWYNEKQYYSSPGFSMATGHFTQVVWKASTSLGFAIAADASGNTVACALYSPPGNFGGTSDYAANVS